jgi:hypothetical protein
MAGRIAFKARTSLAGGGATLERALIDAARPKLRRAADATGAEGIDNIVANASADYSTGSESSRRRGIPSIADPGQYDYTINEAGRGRTGGLELVFTVDNSPGFGGKFGALNFGTGGSYTIEPRSRPQLGNRADQFIVARGHLVEHPGHAGTHFYERGVSEAVANFRSHL